MFNTLQQNSQAAQKSGRRTVFIVSDATAITAETLAHSVLTQFTDLQYDQIRMPFIDTPETAAFYRSLGFADFAGLGCRGFMLD